MLPLNRPLRADSRDARVLRLKGWPQPVVTRKTTVSRFSTYNDDGKRVKAVFCAATEVKEGMACSMHVDPSQLASLLRIQNMIKLCKQLKLPVVYKVNRIKRQPDAAGQSCMSSGDTSLLLQQQQQQYGEDQQQLKPGAGSIELAVVVHVLSDHAFKKYLQYCTTSDLMLLRGLLLKVEVDEAFQHIVSARVQQAFLPKFENEGQDSSIADSIVQQADHRPLVVTIKHSGSLVTLSHEGFAAKNSLDNEFTAGAALLLKSHFQRLLGAEQGIKRLQELMAVLKDRQLAVSFEMVTGCHGHHGQLPAGEYLVTTSAHTISASGQPSFLPWQDFLQLCLDWGLPLNDTWIVYGQTAAAAVRELLDHLALSGCTTAQALQQLDTLVHQQGSGAGIGNGNGHAEVRGIHLPGTYPHDEWQGSRLEGFVVSQGQGLTGPEASQRIHEIAKKMASQVLQLEGSSEDLRKPYHRLLQQSGNKVAATHTAVKSLCTSWLPDVAYQAIETSTDRPSVIDLLEQLRLPLDSTAALHLPDGSVLLSRAALDGLSSQKLQQLVAQTATAGDSTTAALPEDSMTPLQAMQALSGPGGPQQAVLRYKKKMLMWSDAEVGYCMMTFFIRNNLKALRLGEVSYLTALAGTARHTWGLPQALVEKVVYFGRCWSRWIRRHGGVDSVSESNYLSTAESFVSDFLAGVAGDGGEVRPQGAFQGVVLAVDASERLVKQLQRHMHLQHLLQPTSGDLVFSKSLLREGVCLWLSRNQSMPKKNKQATEFISAAAPYAYLLVQPPRASGPTQAAKKITGMHESKVRLISTMLTAPGLLSREQLEQRSYYLPTAFGTAEPKQQQPVGEQPAAAATAQAEHNGITGSDQQEDEVTEERLREAVTAVAEKFGAGSPPGDADPAFITCFVGLPGIGKSELVSQLQQLIANNSDGSSSDISSSCTSVAVLNSDTLKAKQGISGMRYWHQVAGACDSARGGGHCKLVLADKNLVPAPKDNLTRVADIINRSGATTVAVIPTCTFLQTPDQDKAISTPSGSKESGFQQQQQRRRLAADLPFPLELVALCLLRVLQRESHEGGLDKSLAHAMSVVMRFVSYFNNMTAAQLKQQLLGCFQHVVELPVAAVGGDRQVPAAVLAHIAEGLSKMSPNSDPPLPTEWEQGMWQLLEDPANQAAITATALPLENCTARLQGLVAGIINSHRSGDGKAAAAEGAGGLGAGGPSTGISGSLEGLDLEQLKHIDRSATSAAGAVRYIGVAVLEEDQLKQQLQQQLQKLQQQQQQQLLPLSIKSELHVTLWHSNNTDADAAVLEALMTSAGQEVQLQVVAIDCSPEVTAAQVELISAPDVVAESWHQLEYPHITLAVNSGAQAVDSNQLPRRVADAADAAFRVQLQQPVLVVGQLLTYA